MHCASCDPRGSRRPEVHRGYPAGICAWPAMTMSKTRSNVICSASQVVDSILPPDCQKQAAERRWWKLR
eukprot:1368802-Prymnesium_polylepis.1